jgi:hypothetical protein
VATEPSFALLLLRRNGEAQPLGTHTALRKGDEIVAIIEQARTSEAEAELQARGLSRAAPPSAAAAQPAPYTGS